MQKPIESLHRARGFTLVEVMIVVAVIGILAAIAYPSYQESILKARRSEARSAVIELMQQQERFMTQAGTYQEIKTPGAGGTAFKTYAGDSRAEASYLLGATACASGSGGGATLSLAECVRISATPQKPDPAAGVIWMESSGKKDCDGTRSAEPRVCWK